MAIGEKMPKLRGCTGDGLLVFLPLLFLAPAMVLLLLPVISVPINKRLFFFEWWFPEGSTVTGYRWGLWGGCRTASVSAYRACTVRTWGYSLTMQDLGLPAGTGVQARFTRALGIILPVALGLTIIALVLSVLASIAARTQLRRRSLPSPSHAGKAQRPRLMIAAAVVTFLALPFAIGCGMLGYLAFRHARDGINGATGIHMAALGPCHIMCVIAPVLLAAALVSWIWAIVRHGHFQESLRRRADGPTISKPFDPETPGLQEGGFGSFGSGGKWAQMRDDDSIYAGDAK